MANDDIDTPITADNTLNHPLTMPPVLHEKLDKSQIANKRSPAEIERLKLTTPGVDLSSLENDVTQRLLRLPRLTVPQFATQLQRDRQLNFQPFVNAAIPGSDAANTSSPTGSIDTPAQEALRRLQVTATTGLYQFQRSIALPYMRKSLSLSYEHVTLTRSLVTLTAGMAQMLESKLEAIKLNTGAPDSKKTTLLGELRRTMRQQTLTRVATKLNDAKVKLAKAAYDKVAPHLHEHIITPMAASVRAYRAGTKTAGDVAGDARDTAYAAYYKARAGFADWRQGRAGEGFGFPPKASPDAYSQSATETPPSSLYKPAGLAAHYGLLGGGQTGQLLLEGPKAPTPPPASAMLMLEGPRSTSLIPSGVRPASFPVQKYIGPSPISGRPPITIDGEVIHEPGNTPGGHPTFIHPAPHMGAAADAGKEQCLSCCDDLLKRLDRIYDLMHTHFTKQETYDTTRLKVAQNVERDEEGPRVGSYAAHLKELEQARKHRAAEAAAMLAAGRRRTGGVGAAAATAAGGLGSWLSGGIGGLIQSGLNKVLGDTVGGVLGKVGGKAARLGGGLLKRGAKYAGGAALNAAKSLFGGAGRKGLVSEAAHVAESAGGKALQLVPTLGEEVLHGGENLVKGTGTSLVNLAEKSALPALRGATGLAEEAAPLLGKGLKLVGPKLLGTIAKKIPFLGALVGAGMAAKDLWKGDYVGAAGNAASGIASMVPGPGTAISALIDAAMMTRDLTSDAEAATPKVTPKAPITAPPGSVNPLVLPGGVITPKPLPSNSVTTAQPPVVQPWNRPPGPEAPPAVIQSAVAAITGSSPGPTGSVDTLPPVAALRPRDMPTETAAFPVDSTPRSSTLTIIQARLRAYGFPATTDVNDVAIVRGILRLEQTYLHNLTAITPWRSITTGDIAWLAFDLGMDSTNPTVLQYLKNWVDFRFVPVYHAYVSAVKSVGASPGNVSTLSASQTASVLGALTSVGQMARSAAGAYLPTNEAYQAYINPKAATTQASTPVTAPPTPPAPPSAAAPASPPATPPAASASPPTGNDNNLAAAPALPSAAPSAPTVSAPTGGVPSVAVLGGVTPRGTAHFGRLYASAAGLTTTPPQASTMAQPGFRGGFAEPGAPSVLSPSAGGIGFSGWVIPPAAPRVSASPPRGVPSGPAAPTSPGVMPPAANTNLPTPTPVTSPQVNLDAAAMAAGMAAAGGPPPVTPRASASPPRGVPGGPAAPTSAASGNIGGLSSKYESSRAGSSAIGYDSTGGVSYGTYQIAANTGTFNQFLAWASKQGGAAADAAKQLSAAGNPNGGKSGPVAQVWQTLAKQGVIGPLEQGFIKETHYDAAFKRLSKPMQDKVNQSKALQEVLFSTSVQHGPGGAASIFNKVDDGKDNTETLIKKIYTERDKHFGSSSPAVQASVASRLSKESNDALQLAAAEEKTPVANTMVAAGNGVATPKGATATDGVQTAANSNTSPGGPPSTGAGNMQVAMNTQVAAMPTMLGGGAPPSPSATAPAAPTPAVNNTLVASIPPTMLPSTSTITQGALSPTPTPTTPADATTPSPTAAAPPVMAATAPAAGHEEVVAALSTVTSAIKDMHNTLASGKMMDPTNQLLQAHLDKPSSIVAPTVNTGGAPASPTKTAANNDLNFSKQMQNAGATPAAA